MYLSRIKTKSVVGQMSNHSKDRLELKLRPWVNKRKAVTSRWQEERKKEKKKLDKNVKAEMNSDNQGEVVG